MCSLFDGQELQSFSTADYRQIARKFDDMLAQLSRSAARAAPVVRRAPLRCLSAVRAIDPSTTDRITVTDSDGPHTLKYLGEQQVRVIKRVDSVFSHLG